MADKWKIFQENLLGELMVLSIRITNECETLIKYQSSLNTYHLPQMKCETLIKYQSSHISPIPASATSHISPTSTIPESATSPIPPKPPVSPIPASATSPIPLNINYLSFNMCPSNIYIFFVLL
eukprot:992779_1